MSLWTTSYKDWDHDDLLKPIPPEVLANVVIDEEAIKARLHLLRLSDQFKAFDPRLTHFGHAGPCANVMLD